MGLALFKEVEEFHAEEVSAQSSLRRTSPTMTPEEIAKQADLNLLKYRTGMIMRQQRVRDAIANLIRHGDKADVARARAETVLHLMAMKQEDVNEERDIGSMVADLHRSTEDIVSKVSTDLGRRIRKADKRIERASWAHLEVSRRYTEMVERNILASLDETLLSLAKAPQPASEVLKDLMERYPVVSDYLAR